MDKTINIRLANIDDMKNVFELSNDDVARANSIHTERIKWEDHIEWFKNKINSKNVLFYVLEYEHNFAGYCHIDEEENNKWVTTIHISKEYRGKNLGYNLLKRVCEFNKDKNIISYVKMSNIASKKIFEKNNFKIFDNTTINNEKYHVLERIK